MNRHNPEPIRNSHNAGFTLLEIMIVVLIVALLAVIAIPSFVKARQTSRINRAKNDLRIIAQSITQLAFDTGQWPGGVQAGGIANPEIWNLALPSSGLAVDDGSTFTRWQGPYMTVVPLDPWDNDYFFDPDYNVNGKDLTVVGSFGPNGEGPNVYDADNIYVVVE